MKLIKFNNKFYKLIQCIDINSNGIETWLTDFNDKVYLYKKDFLSLDNNRFYKAEVMSIEPEVADLFFKIKGG